MSGKRSIAPSRTRAELSIGDGPLGIGGEGPGGVVLLHASLVAGLGFDGDEALATAHARERLVVGDAAEPGRPPRRAVELVEVGERRDVSLLHRVLDLGAVAQHGRGSCGRRAGCSAS